MAGCKLAMVMISLLLSDGRPQYEPFVYELEYNTVADGWHELRQVIFRTSTGDIMGWRNQTNVTVYPQVEGGLFDAAWAPVPVRYRMIRFTETTYDAEVLFREFRLTKEGKQVRRRDILP